MHDQQLKSDVILVFLAVALASASVLHAQNRRIETRVDSRPAKTQSQKPRERRPIPDYQRDPVRLVKEFYLDRNANSIVFDLSLTVENGLGTDQWAKLDEKRKAVVSKAFENTVNEIFEEWGPENNGQVRVLKSEIKGNRATITVLRELDLIRLSLRSREGAWFITEHELVDESLPEFADAIEGALNPGIGRGQAYDMPTESALKYVDKLIAKQGESPHLLLLKYRVLVSKQLEEEAIRSSATLKHFQSGKAEANEGKAKEPQPMDLQDDRALELLLQITRRWPDFAPGHLALAFDLLYFGNENAVLSSLSKDAERSIEPLRTYIELVPDDPRPWRDMAHAYALIEKNAEAESALRTAIELDPAFLDHRAMLVSFLLSADEPEKAKTAFDQMLKVAPDPDEAFDGLYDEGGLDIDYAKMVEDLLLSFPKELDKSKSGLILLAIAQDTQNRQAEAVKTLLRAIAINAEADDCEYLSQLYRQQRRFTEALNAANQAIRLDANYAAAHFERACSLAQLGRRREALAALKQMMALDPDLIFDIDEPDLQPLANMPEFKALKEKAKEAGKENTKPMK